MSQNELITGWIYKEGELVRQRFNRMRLLKIFSGIRFSIHKKLFGIKEEEIIFTNYKITSTNKTWILNDENTKLKEVIFSHENQSPALTFRGTAIKGRNTNARYSINIPVPATEVRNAKKVCSYFKDQLQAPGNPGNSK